MDISIDCFAGGGGASTGYQMATGQEITIAINHDPEAIRMHKMNHPYLKIGERPKNFKMDYTEHQIKFA